MKNAPLGTARDAEQYVVRNGAPPTFRYPLLRQVAEDVSTCDIPSAKKVRVLLAIVRELTTLRRPPIERIEDIDFVA